MADILPFPTAQSAITPEQALTDSLSYPLTDVLIIGYDDGELHIRSSGLDRKEALWLLEKAKEFVLNPEE